MDVAEPGRALNRDIRRSEVVETDLSNFIERRDKKRRLEEGDRREEEAWAESTRKAEVARKEQIRLARIEFHRAQARRHEAVLSSLVRRHKQEADRYENLVIYPTGVGGDAA